VQPRTNDSRQGWIWCQAAELPSRRQEGALATATTPTTALRKYNRKVKQPAVQQESDSETTNKLHAHESFSKAI
jgi:hypothetical protein